MVKPAGFDDQIWFSLRHQSSHIRTFLVFGGLLRHGKLHVDLLPSGLIDINNWCKILFIVHITRTANDF